MTVGGAILLGAVLAPTDRVLAGDLQIGLMTVPGAEPMEVARRRGIARARVAVARMLEVVLHRLQRDGANSRSARIPPQTPPRPRRRETDWDAALS